MALLKFLKILANSGSRWMNPLAMLAPVYAGGVVGAALPLNAPPAPLPLGAAHLLGIVTKVLQWLYPLHHYRDADCESDHFVGAGGMSGCLL